MAKMTVTIEGRNCDLWLHNYSGEWHACANAAGHIVFSRSAATAQDACEQLSAALAKGARFFHGGWDRVAREASLRALELSDMDEEQA